MGKRFPSLIGLTMAVILMMPNMDVLSSLASLDSDEATIPVFMPSLTGQV